MTIDVELSGREFRTFTVFDTLKRRKLWRGPVIFAAILGASSFVCFSAAPRQGALLLGNILLTIGLGLPCIYFAFFFSSLNRQIRTQGLSRPQKVYTVELTDNAKAITAANGKETARYEWDKLFHAYRGDTAVYLYTAPTRALILPYTCVEEPEKLWKLICKKLPKEKCTTL